MKVMELKTKTVITVNESYGERLIQQGMAILPPDTHAPKANKEPAAKEQRKKGDG